MNTLLIFFALPIATIILAAVLQKLIKCPALVAAIFFAIYLIVAFAFFDATFLIAVIIYTIIAFITAVIVKAICCFIRNCTWWSDCMGDNCFCNRREEGGGRSRGRNYVSSTNVLELNEGNETFSISNGNACTCRGICNTNTFNNGYNRGYNNGYDNGYNNAFDFWNDNESENGCCLQNTSNNVVTISNPNRRNRNCRRRCRN